MDDQTYQDRRLPSLLDRLFDTSEGPGRLHSEADWQRAVQDDRHRLGSSMREACQLVVKDLDMLLNARARPFDDSVHRFPEAARSVVNYGVLDLTGATMTVDMPHRIEQEVRQAILNFEPRVVPGTLRVSYNPGKASGLLTQSMAFEIAAEVCPLPVPEPLHLRTVVDLSTGDTTVTEQGHG